ncbi:MAG: hypothetical protein A2074_08840 [Candidatus Aquicultor primus]|uniref:Intracellular proteinase inhibitor BsuPI domain-containing protein n=1 Tax=Candidatus Aquicultor primus TaxID=1797195 RepID=A0A1F2UXI1_9ACTN|nr:MAG: hypothetical protein A2074_08840 [Candidatus Aquicultor primus]HCG99211.1 hypothetical protein [Actinomycetota bacterium]
MRYLRVLPVFAIALFLIAGCGGQQPSPEKNAFYASDAREHLELTLIVPKEQHVAGETYYATVSLTNLGSRELTFDMGHLFGLTVLDDDGAVVWPDGTIPALDESQLETLAEGERYDQKLAFKVMKPGIYTVRSRLAKGEARKSRSGRISVAEPPALVAELTGVKVIAASEATSAVPGEEQR